MKTAPPNRPGLAAMYSFSLRSPLQSFRFMWPLNSPAD
jgi:hypothetical protein